MNNIYNLILFNLLIWPISSCTTKDDVAKEDDMALVQQSASPAVSYLFQAQFSECSYGLLEVQNTGKITEENIHLVRRAYLFSYAYWYYTEIEKKLVTDKSFDRLSYEILAVIDGLDFDIKNDLTVIRNPNNKDLSKEELIVWYRFVNVPCSESNFISEEKYNKLAAEFSLWAESILKKYRKIKAKEKAEMEKQRGRIFKE